MTASVPVVLFDALGKGWMISKPLEASVGLGDEQEGVEQAENT